MAERYIARVHDYEAVVYGRESAERWRAESRAWAATPRGDAELIDHMMAKRVFDAGAVLDVLDEAELRRVCGAFGVQCFVASPGDKAQMVAAMMQEMWSERRDRSRPRPPPPPAERPAGRASDRDPRPFEA